MEEFQIGIDRDWNRVLYPKTTADGKVVVGGPGVAHGINWKVQIPDGTSCCELVLNEKCLKMKVQASNDRKMLHFADKVNARLVQLETEMGKGCDLAQQALNGATEPKWRPECTTHVVQET